MAKKRSTSPSRQPPVKAMVPLEVYLRQRPWKQRGLTALILLMIAALSWADYAGWFLYAGSDWKRYHGQSFRVLRVIDGDTLIIDAPDRDRASTRVRLWGINSPELARREGDVITEPAQPLAEEARALAQRLSDGQVVRLELESHRMRGDYGRILAYMQLPDGTYLNEQLLVQGLAKHDPRFLHSRTHRYAMLEAQAQAERTGLWARRLPTDDAAADTQPAP